MSNEFFKVKKGLHITPSTQPEDPQVGDIIIDSSDSNKLKRYDGSVWKEAGGGQGGINYLSDTTDAEAGVGSFVGYKDGSGATPVDGTSGLNVVSVSTSATNPLRGTKSYILTKDAANRQGEGWSIDFTIDKADQAKMLRGTFDYAIASGTYTDDAVQMWVYDKTNAALIAVTPFKIKNHTLPSEQFSYEFQTAYNSTSYRLIFHIAGTDTNAYDLKLDNIQLGPQVARGYGSVVTDWTALTTTGSWTSNTTYTGFWRRVGDVKEYKIKVKLNGGGPNSTSLTVNLPNGDVVDTAKIPAAAGQTEIGFLKVLDWGNTQYTGIVNYESTTSVRFSVDVVNSTYGDYTSITQAVPMAFGDLDEINAEFSLPIVGLSAQSQIISTDSPNGVVAATMALSASQSTSNAVYTKVNFDVSVYDNTGIVDVNNKRIVFKSPGSYVVRGKVSYDATSAIYSSILALLINGVDQNKYSFSGKNGTGTAIHSTPFLYRLDNIKAGDYVEIKSYQDSGASLNILGNNAAGEITAIYVEMLQGPSQVLASASTSAAYYWNSFNPSDVAGTLTNGSSSGTKVEQNITLSNSSGTVTATFTVSGTYSIGFGETFSAANAYTFSRLTTTIGGTATRYAAPTNYVSTGQDSADSDHSLGQSIIVRAIAGQTFTMLPKVEVTSGAAASNFTVNAHLAISRIGNY